MSAIDQALTMLDGCGPEFGGGLSNHGPMAAEALVRLGRPELVEGWVARYRIRLGDRPSSISTIDPTDWQEALGDLRRVTDWEVFFARELDGAPWAEVLERWVPRLAPGIMAGATHGLIRTAHAVRSLAEGETSERRTEFVAGLSYWAARYQELPGVPGPAHPRLPSQAIDAVPVLPHSLRTPNPGTIFRAVADLDGFEPFAGAVDLAAPGDDLDGFISDLTVTMARRYLQNAGSAAIAFVHTVTAPSALRMIAPFVTPGTARLAARYAWQACAAIHSRSSQPVPVVLPDVLPAREDLIDRAVFSMDEHAIKFTEACLREYVLHPDPAFLAGPADLSARFGRRVRDTP